MKRAWLRLTRSWREASRIWAEEQALAVRDDLMDVAEAIHEAPVPAAIPPRVPGKHPAPGHGGLAKRIDVYGDGRTEITSRNGDTEVIPGSCPACLDSGHCSLCAAYPVYDAIRGRYVHRYQRCPAHQEPSHAQE